MSLESPRFVLIHQLMRVAGVTTTQLAKESIVSKETMTALRAGTGVKRDTLKPLAECLELKRRSAVKEFEDVGINVTIETSTIMYGETEPSASHDSLVRVLGNISWRKRVNEIVKSITRGTCAIEHVYFLLRASPDIRSSFSDTISQIADVEFQKEFAKVWPPFIDGIDSRKTAKKEGKQVKVAAEVREEGLLRLRHSLEELLTSGPLRAFLCEKNKLSLELSASDLADLLISTRPEIRLNPQHNTAMCYLRSCCNSPGPTAASKYEIADGIHQLIGLLAPISFVIDDAVQFAELVQKVEGVSHVAVPCTKPTIAASVLALYLGKPVDFEILELSKSPLASSGSITKSTNKLHGTDATPILGEHEDGLVSNVASALAPLIGAVDSTVIYVNAALQDLLDSQGTVVCLWINRALLKENLELLHVAFPLLFILVCSSAKDGDINALVVHQINRVREFVKEHR